MRRHRRIRNERGVRQIDGRERVLTQEIDARIARDGKYPRRGRRFFGVVQMGFPPDIHKRFLHDILDARLIGPSAGNERTNAGREEFEQEFERVLIAITRNGTQKTR